MAYALNVKYYQDFQGKANDNVTLRIEQGRFTMIGRMEQESYNIICCTNV